MTETKSSKRSLIQPSICTISRSQAKLHVSFPTTTKPQSQPPTAKYPHSTSYDPTPTNPDRRHHASPRSSAPQPHPHRHYATWHGSRPAFVNAHNHEPSPY